MNPALAGAAMVLLLSGLALVYAGRDQRAVRDRLLGLSGRIVARGPTREEGEIARPVASTGFMARVTGWFGFGKGLLPMRRIPIALVLVLAATACGLAGWGATFFTTALPAAAAGVACAIGVLRLAFTWEVSKSREAAFVQIPDTVGLMVRAVRAGLPIGEAVRSVAREMPDPTRAEFQRLLGEVAIGSTLDRALWGIFERTGLREYAFLSVVIGLQSQTGGSLAEALENIGEIVRKRVAMAAKASALAGQAKASAGILLALPPFGGVAVTLVKPGYLDVLFVDPRGHTLLMIAVGLLLMGLLVIRTMIKRSTSE